MTTVLANMRPHRLASALLVVLAVATVLGHICALPFHVHAGAITTHEERESHHGGGDTGEDAVHAASCDAVKSPSAAGDAVVLVPAGTVPIVTSAPVRHLVEAEASLVGTSPPLFLLHAVLLI